MGKTGSIFNIQRYCIHDGPGIRTTVFMKGCGMRCAWCHNPESWYFGPQIQRFPERCVGCGRCRGVCPASLVGADARETGEGACTGCGRCAEACCAQAHVLRGRTVTVGDVIAEVARDKAFYDESGGGVTFSGGEPLMQPGFLSAMLEAAKDAGINTAVETAGNAPPESLAEAVGHTDLWIYDVKAMDGDKHIRHTGVGNRRALGNLRDLVAAGRDVLVRYTLVPGFNDGDADLAALGEYLSGIGYGGSVEVLPYRSMSRGKYGSLGMACRFAESGDATEAMTEAAVSALAAAGVAAYTAKPAK
ncbi:MAG: glycyl-radical enzyme activating protein [Oscillospiraceae bacterium]|nr:glycyl-radical enzyme activating protein [Oscillospiraceae bacterium]